jgi:SAM-dependent methyltransferase
MKQSEFWGGEAGDVWAREADRMDPALQVFGAAAMDALAPAPGERVLDIGCGAGSTSRALAGQVGATGHVVGVDVSGPLLAVAKARGGGPTYLHADAGSTPLPTGFDAAFSRFGVMFFEDPVAAFANIRRALRPDGRLAFVCWRAAAENAWARDVLSVALPLLREPPMPTPPDAPGPFAFADAGRVRGVLDRAGWRDVGIVPLDTGYLLGATPEEAADLVLVIGPLARLVREQELDPGPVRAAIEGMFRGRVEARGVVVPAASWVVTARA